MGYIAIQNDENKKMIDEAIKNFVNIIGVACIEENKYYELSTNDHEVSRFKFISFLDKMFIKIIKILAEGYNTMELSTYDTEPPAFNLKTQIELKNKENKKAIDDDINHLMSIIAAVCIREIKTDEKPFSIQNEADRWTFIAMFEDLALGVIQALLDNRKEIITKLLEIDDT